MRAITALLGGLCLFSVSACETGGQPSPPAAAYACKGAFNAPPANPGSPPPAVLHDIAGSPSEFEVGTPDIPVPPLDFASATVPQVRGARIFDGAAQGASGLIDVRSASGCHVLHVGQLDSVSPAGDALLLFGPQSRPLLDAQGRQLADLPRGNYAWTWDDELVGADGHTVRVFRADGHLLRQKTDSGSPLSAVGPHGMALEEPGHTALLDASSGALTPLDNHYDLVSGSPDGSWLTVVHGSTVTIRHPGGGPPITPAPPGPLISALWSPDSAWLALNSTFGALLLHPADGRAVDLGTLEVASWAM